MKKKYFYNLDTDKLHIYGLCHVSKSLPVHIMWFDNENEALAYDGRAVGMCWLCQKKKEEMKK